MDDHRITVGSHSGRGGRPLIVNTGFPEDYGMPSWREYLVWSGLCCTEDRTLEKRSGTAGHRIDHAGRLRDSKAHPTYGPGNRSNVPHRADLHFGRGWTRNVHRYDISHNVPAKGASDDGPALGMGENRKNLGWARLYDARRFPGINCPAGVINRSRFGRSGDKRVWPLYSDCAFTSQTRRTGRPLRNRRSIIEAHAVYRELQSA